MVVYSDGSFLSSVLRMGPQIVGFSEKQVFSGDRKRRVTDLHFLGVDSRR